MWGVMGKCPFVGTNTGGRASAVSGSRACPAKGLCARQWNRHMLHLVMRDMRDTSQVRGQKHPGPHFPQGSSTDEMLESARLTEHLSAGHGAGGSLFPHDTCCPA